MATSNAQIRQALPGEGPCVADVLKEAAQWLRDAGIPLWQEEELEVTSICRDVAASLYWVAELGGEVVGTLRFQLEDLGTWPESLPNEACYVHRLAVRRRHAGSGLSSDLLRWAVVRTSALNRRYLRLDCDAARPRLRAIYENFGFRYHSDKQVGPYLVARYEYECNPEANYR